MQFKLLMHVETRRRPRITDYTKAEFILATDGCGSLPLQYKLTWLAWFIIILLPVCRRHDFRYAIGFKEWHRIFADLLLGLEGIIYCLVMVFYFLVTGKWIKMFKCFICFFLSPLFTLILLPSGWVTFTRYRPDGSRLKGYVDKNVVLSRAALRREEQNPQASIGDKWEAANK